MHSVNPLKAAALANFAADAYLDPMCFGDNSGAGLSREAMALSVAAAGSVTPKPQQTDRPAVLARLASLTDEYSQLLKRIDEIRKLTVVPSSHERPAVGLC